MVWNNTEAWNMLVRGEFAEAAMYPYVHLMGEMFYGLFAFFTLAMIYYKTNDFGTTGVAGIIMAGAALAWLPEQALYTGSIMLTLSVAIILYKVFQKGSSK